jgi:hypothetical protein
MHMCSYYYETLNKYGVPGTQFHITCLRICATSCEYYHRLQPDVKRRPEHGLISGRGNAETVLSKTTNEKYDFLKTGSLFDMAFPPRFEETIFLSYRNRNLKQQRKYLTYSQNSTFLRCMIIPLVSLAN